MQVLTDFVSFCFEVEEMEARSYPENYRNGGVYETYWSHILPMLSGLALENLLSNPVLNLSDGRSGMVLDEVQSLLWLPQ